MTPFRCLLGLLLPLVSASACQGTGPAPSADLTPRLEATEQRLEAIEAKLGAIETKLDAANASLEPVVAWATAKQTREAERKAERDERKDEVAERRSRLGLDGSMSEPDGDTSDRTIEGAAEGIHCTDLETPTMRCRIDQALIDHILSNPAVLAKQSRVVPSIRDGKHLGYKLYGIRRDSLPKLLGIDNGDLITAVNAEPLDSIDRAMSLYTKLRKKTHFEIDIERKGKPVLLVIDLVK